MKFIQTGLKDAYLIEVERYEDERGFFGRVWCERELAEAGLDSNLAQCSISFNRKKGTVRGMHLQLPPFAETKIVRATQGAIYDVIVDLRTDSETYMEWIGVELTAVNRHMLYVPKGFAHGFQTLVDETEVIYMISEFYAPDHARGFQWNDSAFTIKWPEAISVISQKDQAYEPYTPDNFPITTANF